MLSEISGYNKSMQSDISENKKEMRSGILRIRKK